VRLSTPLETYPDKLNVEGSNLPIIHVNPHFDVCDIRGGKCPCSRNQGNHPAFVDPSLLDTLNISPIMDSPGDQYLDSPMEGDDVAYPCKGCGDVSVPALKQVCLNLPLTIILFAQILEEGKAFELGEL
jgi:hypothetical protein